MSLLSQLYDEAASVHVEYEEEAMNVTLSAKPPVIERARSRARRIS